MNILAEWKFYFLYFLRIYTEIVKIFLLLDYIAFILFQKSEILNSEFLIY